MKVRNETKETNPAAEAGPAFSEQEILERAAGVDRAVDQNQAKNPLEAAMSDSPAETVPTADHAIQQSLEVLLTFSVNYLKEARGWSDPGGEKWTAAVSQLGARLLDKYLPGMLNNFADEGALCLLILPWLASNLMRPAKEGDVENNKPDNVVSASDRTFRDRKDNENSIFEVTGPLPSGHA